MNGSNGSAAGSIQISVKQIVITLIVAVITAGVTFAFTEGRNVARLEVKVEKHEQEIMDIRALTLESSRLIQENAVAIARLVGESQAKD